jgi:mono/diheme cytochrome c family protein
VARGKYIVDGVAICGQCHTLRTSSADLDRARWLEGAPLWLEPAAPTEDGHSKLRELPVLLREATAIWSRC